MEALIAVGIVVVVLGLWVMITYNGLVGARNQVDEAWSGIDVQLKRRHDLIPNLVNTVKGYATHEQNVLENVTKARSQAVNANDPGDVAQAENMLTGALRSVFALSEAYPELKADQNFRELQIQLADTEDKIQAARRIYNGNARDYNTRVQRFPTLIIANMFGFKDRDFFEIEDPAERENVEVSF